MRPGKKALVVMKLTVFFMLATLMQASAAAQEQITLSMKNAPLEAVFREIKKQTGYDFWYDARSVQNAGTVNMEVRNQPLTKVLQLCLQGRSLTYEVVDKTIVVRETAAGPNGRETAAIRVKGTVVDSVSRMPLIGVTVRLKGSQTGTTTNAVGKFDLEVPDNQAVLVISFIGYTSREVAVQAGDMTIELAPVREALGEVVVTALGMRKQTRSLTYNVQEIRGEDLNTVKDANFVNALQGKVAGITINASAAGIGGGVRVIMRGAKSLFGNNNALYVVDGIPLPVPLTGVQESGGLYFGRGLSGDGISNFNPEDIESISVLSGPAAAALYGSDAANGVINITTKKGAAGKLRVDVFNNSNFFSPFVLPELQNTYGPSSPDAFDSWGPKLPTPSAYNPRKDFFQTGQNVTNGFNLSGGSATNQTFFSGSMVSGKGIIPNNELSRYNFSIRNTSSYLDNRLNLDLSASFIKVKEQNMLAQGQYSNPLLPVYLFPPGRDIQSIQMFERYDPVRNFNTQFWPFGDMGYSMENPYWINNRELFTNDKNRYLISAAAKYQVRDWLNVSGRVKYDRNQTGSESKLYASTSGILASPAGGYARSSSTDQQLYADLIVNATRQFNDFSVNGSIGSSIQDNQQVSEYFGGNLGQVANLFTYNNVTKASSKYGQGNSRLQRQALFFNGEIGYRRFVYLNFSARNDWSSTLANTDYLKKGFFYPSVGLSAIVTDMADLKSSVLSYLKVRGSVSSVGNALTFNRSTGQLQYDLNTTGVRTVTYAFLAPLQPEKTRSYEAGIDARFWKDRINLTFTAYKSNTFNQLFSITAPQSSGYSTYYANAGNVENKGIEAVLGYNGNLGQVEWNASLNFSLNRNKIIEMLPPVKDGNSKDDVYYRLDSLPVAGTGSFSNVIRTGGQIGDIFVNTLKTDNQGYIYVDQGSGKVTPMPNTFIYAGNSNPRYNMGFRNNFSYRGFDLSFLIQARFGGIVVSQTQAFLDAFGVSKTSADARDNGGVYINGSQMPNVKDYYQIIGGGNGILAPYVYSATNVRLGEASLAYSFPAKFFNNKLRSATVTLTGRNLFMFYNKAPFDPEVAASTGTYYQGIDYFMQPSLRSFGFSVRVGL